MVLAADLGHREAARGALDQADAEPLLEQGEPSAELRLGHADGPAGGGEAAMLDDLGVVVEVVQVLHRPTDRTQCRPRQSSRSVVACTSMAQRQTPHPRPRRRQFDAEDDPRPLRQHPAATGSATASRCARCFPMTASAPTSARSCCSTTPARTTSSRPTRPRGVGEHPHRGFETVTIVYDGEVEHRDSTGNGGVIGPGDVQWMTAGGGILHEEFHSPGFTKAGGPFHMVAALGQPAGQGQDDAGRLPGDRRATQHPGRRSAGRRRHGARHRRRLRRAPTGRRGPSPRSTSGTCGSTAGAERDPRSAGGAHRHAGRARRPRHRQRHAGAGEAEMVAARPRGRAGRGRTRTARRRCSCWPASRSTSRSSATARS